MGKHPKHTHMHTSNWLEPVHRNIENIFRDEWITVMCATPHTHKRHGIFDSTKHMYRHRLCRPQEKLMKNGQQKKNMHRLWWFCSHFFWLTISRYTYGWLAAGCWYSVLLSAPAATGGNTDTIINIGCWINCVQVDRTFYSDSSMIRIFLNKCVSPYTMMALF